jgi:hypothetical protein
MRKGHRHPAKTESAIRGNGVARPPVSKPTKLALLGLTEGEKMAKSRAAEVGEKVGVGHAAAIPHFQGVDPDRRGAIE